MQFQASNWQLLVWLFPNHTQKDVINNIIQIRYDVTVSTNMVHCDVVGYTSIVQVHILHN